MSDHDEGRDMPRAGNPVHTTASEAIVSLPWPMLRAILLDGIDSKIELRDGTEG